MSRLEFGNNGGQFLEPLSMTPIGFIRSNMRVNFDAPHQPDANPATQSIIESHAVLELIAGHRYELALQDLSGFERVWLLWWANRNQHWRPLVLPPRGKMKRRGLFATRSPHRPNPICLTAVRLIGIQRGELLIGNCDLLDGTPILDIKPYIPTIDAFPEAKNGWVAELEAELSLPSNYSVHLSALAEEQLEWLEKEWQIFLLPRAKELLERDPTPHRSRRIGRYGNDRFRMGCGPWRLIFSIDGWMVTIDEVMRGFPLRSLLSDAYTRIPDREAQIAFQERWNSMP